MTSFKTDQDIVNSVLMNLKERGCILSSGEAEIIIDVVREEVLHRYVGHMIGQVEAILDISPHLPDQEILELVAKNVAEYFKAKAATLRIYDPSKGALISYGSYPRLPESRQEAIPFEDTVAGEVIRTRQSYFVPNILDEERYKDKDKIRRQGFYSMMAIPISIPRFSLKDVDTEGVLQIYFEEKDKVFTPLDARVAEMFSRRVSHVIARKRILDLEKLNMTKDKIVEKIFQKLGRRGGIKMKEIFDLAVPELLDTMRVRRCSLFSVQEDRLHVVLEAGYPERQHGIGKIFTVEEPYINAIVNQQGPFGEFGGDTVHPSYILITHPQESRLLPADLKRFLETQSINSVLYIPLRVNNVVNYFLAFDAQAHHQRFTPEDIEVFTFFGRELMKSLSMEKMDDILHDFKNPAIAVAGFSKRVRKILAGGDYPSQKEKVDQALEVILKETSRIQELALTLHSEGREEKVDLTEKLRKRFLINEETIQELGRKNIRLREGRLEKGVCIWCSPLHIERVFDNLLNNATNAIPEKGGDLSIQSYRKDSWAVAEISNSGEIPGEEMERYLHGESRGRGIPITIRLVRRMGGQIEVESSQGQTTFRVMLPLMA
jgi:signal transduction histidine kinase